MTKVTRKGGIQRTPTGSAGARVPTLSSNQAALNAGQAFSAHRGTIKLAELFGIGEDSKLRLARQIGIKHAIVSVNSALSHVPRTRYLETLERIKADFEAAGMTIAGVESHPVPAEKIKLGLPGRDEEIDNYKAAIEALAEVGVPMICYNWMAGLGWYRTRVDVPERGGAFVSEFDNDAARRRGLTEWGAVSED